MPYAANPEDGVRSYYEIVGSGPTIIHYPGAMGTIERWRQITYWGRLGADALPGYQHAILEPRGIGNSDKPTEIEAYFRRMRALDVVGVLDDLGIEKAHYIGYSMGGLVGWGIAAYAIERFKSLIIGAAHPFEWDEIIVDYVRTHTPASFRPAAEALAHDPSFADILPHINIPVLAWAGTEDTNDDRFAKTKQGAELVPTATFFALEGQGHEEGVIRDDLFLPQVEAFLNRVEARKE